MRNRNMCSLIAIAGLLLTKTAAAIPVSVINEIWMYDHFAQVQTDAGNSRFGDSVCLAACENGWTFRQQISNESGGAFAIAYGHVASFSSATDESFNWGAVGTLAALAHVDDTLTEGRATATAGMHWSPSVSFLVTEPVLFTGTHNLDGFVSGSVLQPGTYWSREFILPDLRVEAEVGETVFQTLTRGIGYNFTAVPAPPAIALLLLGMIGIVGSRSVSPRRTNRGLALGQSQ